MTLDFRYRIATLFFIMLDLCLVIAFISFLPAYFFSTVKEKTSLSRLEAQKLEKLPLFDQQSLDAIKGVNKKLNLIDDLEKKKFVVSEKVVQAILERKRADIKITAIQYMNLGTEGKKINISGTAPSREVLLLFRQSLEEDSRFKNVDLPISNFIKGSNIEFSLSLMPA